MRHGFYVVWWGWNIVNAIINYTKFIVKYKNKNERKLQRWSIVHVGQDRLYQGWHNKRVVQAIIKPFAINISWTLIQKKEECCLDDLKPTFSRRRRRWSISQKNVYDFTLFRKYVGRWWEELQRSGMMNDVIDFNTFETSYESSGQGIKGK